MPLQVFMTLGGQVGHALTFSKPLLRFPRVNWVDAIMARFLLNFVVVCAASFLILSGIILFEQLDVLLRWGAIFQAMTLAACLGLGVGCLNAFLFMRFPAWQQVWSLLTRPLFLISGVMILYENTPPFAQQILWYNPLMHITGLMRHGFYPLYRPDFISLVYVSVCILIPMVLGLLLLRRHHRTLLYR